MASFRHLAPEASGSERVRRLVPRLVELHVVGAGHRDHRHDPVAVVVRAGAELRDPSPRSSAMVDSRSSTTKLIAWCRGVVDPSCSGPVGWTPSSLGPVLKISQLWSPVPASTFGKPSTSLKNAAGGVGIVGVDQRVTGEDHVASVPRRFR